MIESNKLYHDEAYALKVLINLIDKYFVNDEEKLKEIKSLASLIGCMPGRRVGKIFHQKKLSEDDQKVVQEIINIYG